jgi:hypothetical protein
MKTESLIEEALRRTTTPGILEIRALMKRTVLRDLSWYKKATVQGLVAHRVFGTLIIVLSVSLPLVASTRYIDDEEFRNRLVSVLGIFIALISGLRSFYRWGEVYMANMRGMVELKNQVSEWELAMIGAECRGDPEESLSLAIAATRQVLAARDLVDKRNTEDYSQFFAALEKKELS